MNLQLPRKRVKCPFCDGGGCCFCEYDGNIFIGTNEIIKDEAGLNSIGVKYLKENDPQEPWIELWEHFLDEKNVPKSFKDKHQMEDSISRIPINNNSRILKYEIKTDEITEIICKMPATVIDFREKGGGYFIWVQEKEETTMSSMLKCKIVATGQSFDSLGWQHEKSIHTGNYERHLIVQQSVFQA